MTTTSPSRASRLASYVGAADPPVMNAPPWIHTITGRPSASTGAHTLRVRQSSSVGPASKVAVGKGGGIAVTCGAAGPNATAGRTPAHGSAGAGGRQRRSPVGGAAYGI